VSEEGLRGSEKIMLTIADQHAGRGLNAFVVDQPAFDQLGQDIFHFAILQKAAGLKALMQIFIDIGLQLFDTGWRFRYGFQRRIELPMLA